MKRSVAACWAVLLLATGCERRLVPEDYERDCSDVSECLTVRWMACTSECAAMTINARETDRVLAELQELDGTCPFVDGSAPSCRTSAFSDACVDGVCVMLDVAGKNLGTTTIGPDEGELLPD